MASEPTIGALVEVTAGRGTVRFIGTTSFAPGRWVGIELSEPKGKNNGSVQGVVYFQCKSPYGVFVRATQVKVLHNPSGSTPSTGPSTLTTPPSALRPVNGHKRTSSTGTGLTRVPSFKSSSPASPRSLSPAKPSGLSAQTASIPAPSRLRTFGSSSPTKAVAVQPRRVSPGNKVDITPVHSSPAEVHSPPQSLLQSEPAAVDETIPLKEVPVPVALTIDPPSVTTAPEVGTSNVRETQLEQELQEIRAKLRVVEAKRTDEARNTEKLQAQLADANAFVAARPKLQAKLNSLQQEIIVTRRALADAEQLAKLNEGRLLDAQEQLEMVMLDKEVAEERAESAEAELQSLQDQVLASNVQAVQEPDEGEESEVDSAKKSMAYVQMEKHNQRLKDALIRLRDVSQETETEHRHRIAELERELSGVAELHSDFESTLIKLTNAENQIDDLKLQLDDALGAEDMLVQLTERNLMLSEKIEEMRITIEDLEALKELNDELEESHVEAEKTLQEDLNTKESQIREQAHKIEELEDNCQDLESTILRFRDLVLQLQADLNTMRAQTENAQSESAAAVSQTAAMMSLNLKLQSSASKNQARNIELELRKIEARELKELFSIVQLYLPQPYVDNDSDAASCYLAFQRLSLKADIISDVVAQTYGLPDALSGPVTDTLVGVCDMRGRIGSLSHLCRRFAAILRKCDVESFLNSGRIYSELAPMEKRIDLHLDLLRREEFRESDCVNDINRIQAQLEHYAETYFNSFTHDLGERQLGYVVALDFDLDTFIASVGLTKTSLQAIMKDPEITVNTEELEPETILFEPLQQLIDQCKGAKAISKKFLRRLEDLVNDSGALTDQLTAHLEALNNKVAVLVNFGIQLAQRVMTHLTDVRTSKLSLQLPDITAFVRETAVSAVGQSKSDGGASWSIISQAIQQLIQDSSAVLPLALDTQNVIKLTGTPPWIIRVEDIKAAMAVNAEAERKVAVLNEEIQGLARGIRSRELNLQEANVKIEQMERRLEVVKKQAEIIADLESQLMKAGKQEKAYEDAMEQLQSDLDTLEQENAKLKASSAMAEKQGPQVADSDAIVVEGNLETSHLLEQIEGLRGAVRFLRQENSYLKGQDLLRELQALPPLRSQGLRPPTPALDPSMPEDDSDSDSSRPPTPPTLRSLAAETKILYRDVISFSSTPRVVDLSALNKRITEESKGGKFWMRKKETPAQQLLERRLQGERLSERVRGLLAVANSSGIPS